MKIITILTLAVLILPINAFSSNYEEYTKTIHPRCRVIIDNDFSGDPDGLFELTHFLLSKSVKIEGIIGSHLKPGDGFDPSTQQAANAAKNASVLVKLMGMENKVKVYQGSNTGLDDINTPKESDAADFIIKEALRTDTELPLYVVCGAGLTDIASAYLKNPDISKHLTLIWIGGHEHEGLAVPPPNGTELEYNFAIDLNAGKVIFNKSEINLWQVPRNVYRQTLISYAELIQRVQSQGKVGEFLTTKLKNVFDLCYKYNINIGETYILGDSPLVLLTALQSSFEADPSSSSYVTMKCPKLNDKGLYEDNAKGREIRVYTQNDNRLMFEDFFAKLQMFNNK